MTLANRLIGLLALLLGAAWALLARGLPMQQAGSPGPGFFPLWLGLLLAVLGLALLLQTRAASPEPPAWSGRLGTTRVLVTLAALVAYVGLAGLLGFALSTALFLTITVRFWGGYRWRTVLALAAGLALANYAVFQLWFGLSLPTGALFDLG